MGPIKLDYLRLIVNTNVNSRASRDSDGRTENIIIPDSSQAEAYSCTNNTNYKE